MKQIDNKHHISTEGARIIIVKTSNNQPIPDEEPTILFRGRDTLALPMLYFYRKLCVEDGCTTYQLNSLDNMIKKFANFAATSSTMKQPGEGK